MKVIFIGEKPVSSAPTLTWAKALSRAGVEYKFIDFSKTGTCDWIKQVMKADVIIGQWYGIVPEFEMRQLTLAVMLGCPIVRKWSGSDIYYALNDSELKTSTQSFDKLVTLNLTSEHIGIIEELKSIGLTGKLINQVINDLPETVPSKLNKAVLAYLPDTRYEFYGYSYIERLIQKYSGTEFVIIADKNHSLAKYNNVSSLGWVDDMEPVWNRIGLLIRITEHDGFPRSIVEALSRNKYVIHNREYEGCWYANSQQEIEHYLERFLKVKETNLKGNTVVKNILSGGSTKELYSALVEIRISLKTRMQALYYLFKSIIK